MRSKNKLGTLAVSLGLFFGLLAVYLNRNSLYDAWRLHNYQPSTQVSDLASADTMTDYARHMFYINRPSIQNKSAFNQSCPNDGGERTIILGCYHDNQTGIFLYSVTDPKLDGVEQVTAAHETLHAVYDRLSSKERTYVNGLLQDYYKNGLKDKRVLATIESYKQSEPNDLVNEMHSVFGTELTNLPAPLEAYYSKYFSNRHKVAEYADKYQKTFTNSKALAERYLAQIKAIEQQALVVKMQIDNREASLRAENQAIENQRNHTQDPAAFNARVDSYNAAVATYRDLVSQYNSLINQHNSLVAKYQDLTIETNQLIQELNSRAASLKSQ